MSNERLDEALWEQALDDAAHTGDYTPAHQYELNARLEAEQAEKEALFNAVVRAQTELQSAASFLITEAIGEGEPSRDITSHPDYIEANEALIRAQSALEAYTKGVSPEI